MSSAHFGTVMQERMTYIHVGSKEHDGSWVELVRNDNLRVLAIIVLTNPDLRSGDFDQF